MELGAVSSFRDDMERVVTHVGMLSVRIIRIKDKKLWGIGRGGQHTNRVSRGNRNFSWKWIRFLSGFFGTMNIINGNGREIWVWSNAINFKRVDEAVINSHIVVFTH